MKINNRSIKRSITGVSVILILTFFFVLGLFLFQKYRAISVIERYGGHIGFDYHDYGPNKNSIPNIGIWAETEKVSNGIREDSLHRWIECPVLGHPYVISLKTVNDDVLRAVKRFPTIRISELTIIVALSSFDLASAQYQPPFRATMRAIAG